MNTDSPPPGMPDPYDEVEHDKAMEQAYLEDQLLMGDEVPGAPTMACQSCDGTGSYPPHKEKKFEALVSASMKHGPEKPKPKPMPDPELEKEPELQAPESEASISLTYGASPPEIEIQKLSATNAAVKAAKANAQKISKHEQKEHPFKSVATEGGPVKFHEPDLDGWKKAKEKLEQSLGDPETTLWPIILMAANGQVDIGKCVVGVGDGYVEQLDLGKHTNAKVIGVAVTKSMNGVVYVKVNLNSQIAVKAGESTFTNLYDYFASKEAKKTLEGASSLLKQVASLKKEVAILAKENAELKEFNHKLTVIVGAFYMKYRGGPKNPKAEAEDALRRRFRNIADQL